jgi:hypothetical protein
MRVDRVIDRKTDLFDRIKQATHLEDDVVFSCYRNVASELMIYGARV